MKQPKFKIDQMVYLKTDIEQHERIVTNIKQTQGSVVYGLSFGVEYSDYYCFEMSDEENTLKKVK